MNVNKKLAAVTLAGTIIVCLTACDNGVQAKPQANENKQAAAGIINLLTAQPVHAYDFSQLRLNLQEIEDAQAHGVVTTAFFMQRGQRDPIFSCPSIGAPIASTDQLTNPLQAVSNSDSQSSWATSIGQMDPTGLYTGNSTGTYVMCVGADGTASPVYWEGDVMTAFAPAHWDYDKHQMVVDGPSGSHFSGLKK